MRYATAFLACLFLAAAHTSEQAEVRAASVTAFDAGTLLSGSQTLLGFTVNTSSSGGGTLVTDSNQTSDNADLNGLLNGGVDFDFQRLRFNPNDGTATLNLDITNANSDPNIRLLLGLTDVDRGESQVLMSGGSPVPASLILAPGSTTATTVTFIQRLIMTRGPVR